MSTIAPDKNEFEDSDSYKLARNIAWVVRTLWTGAAALVIATVWVVSLANDVSANAEAVKKNETELAEREAAVDAVPEIVASLSRIERLLGEADTRQRNIQSTVDKLGTEVEQLKHDVDKLQ